MYRDILTNRWFLGGVGFLIVFAVGCYFWYQHDIADERKAAAEAQELLRQSEIAKKVADTDSKIEQAAGVSTENSTLTVERPTTKKKVKDTASDETSANLTQGTQEADKEVRVSPYGFGPYPELPNGWRDAWDSLTAEDELAMRVWIKLLDQGIPVVGIGYVPPNRLLVPTIQGTVYIGTDDKGYIISVSGHPDDKDAIEAIRKGKLQDLQNLVKSGAEIPEGNPLMLTVDDLPEYLKVVDVKDAIDPYQFLNLNKE